MQSLKSIGTLFLSAGAAITLSGCEQSMPDNALYRQLVEIMKPISQVTNVTDQVCPIVEQQSLDAMINDLEGKSGSRSTYYNKGEDYIPDDTYGYRIDIGDFSISDKILHIWLNDKRQYCNAIVYVHSWI